MTKVFAHEAQHAVSEEEHSLAARPLDILPRLAVRPQMVLCKVDGDRALCPFRSRLLPSAPEERREECRCRARIQERRPAVRVRVPGVVVEVACRVVWSALFWWLVCVDDEVLLPSGCFAFAKRPSDKFRPVAKSVRDTLLTSARLLRAPNSPEVVTCCSEVEDCAQQQRAADGDGHPAGVSAQYTHSRKWCETKMNEKGWNKRVLSSEFDGR